MYDFIKVPKKEANIAREALIQNNLYNKGIKAKNDSKYVYFPVQKSKFKVKELKKYPLVKKKGEKYTTTRSFRDILINDYHIKDYIGSYDTVGDIAIIKVTDEMLKKEKEIARSLLKSNPIIKTVVKKTSKHHGKYRVEDVKYLAGKRTFKTQVKESNCIFNIRLGKMFFSPRLSFERERCAEFVKDKKTVAVFFSGVGPFSIIIGKRNPKAKVYSIELNKEAHKCAIENIKQNNVNNVEAICDDVAKYAQKLKNKCDYIIMPLPKTSDLFLESAYTCIKKGKNPGQITIYKFVPKNKPYSKLLSELRRFAKTKNKKIIVVFKRVVRNYSPDIVQVAVDFKFVKKT